MMSGHCCLGEPASRRLARRLSRGAASVLPAALLALLPKCPLCLAAWLTAVTGAGFSAAGADLVRGALLLLTAGALASVAPPGGRQPRFVDRTEAPAVEVGPAPFVRAVIDGRREA